MTDGGISRGVAKLLSAVGVFQSWQDRRAFLADGVQAARIQAEDLQDRGATWVV